MGSRARSRSIDVRRLNGTRRTPTRSWSTPRIPSRLSAKRNSRFTFWSRRGDDGRAVTAVDLPVTSPVREAFSRDPLGMPASAVSARWKQASSLDKSMRRLRWRRTGKCSAYVRLETRRNRVRIAERRHSGGQSDCLWQGGFRRIAGRPRSRRIDSDASNGSGPSDLITPYSRRPDTSRGTSILRSSSALQATSRRRASRDRCRNSTPRR